MNERDTISSLKYDLAEAIRVRNDAIIENNTTRRALEQLHKKYEKLHNWTYTLCETYGVPAVMEAQTKKYLKQLESE
jgi:hypothetical protein